MTEKDHPFTRFQQLTAVFMSALTFLIALNHPQVVAAAPPLTPEQAQQRIKETTHLQAEDKAIADWLLLVQRAGWEDNDAKAYNTQWAKDATLTWSRSSKTGPYDHTVDAAQIIATRKITLYKGKAGTLIRPTQISIEREGNLATVDWVVQVGTPDAHFKTLTAEKYQLVKTPSGWKVKANRVWVLEITEGDATTKMNQQEWDRRDLAVQDAVDRRDLRAVPYLLLDAYRFGQAHEAAVTITERTRATAEDWVVRGSLAGIACQAQDIKPSFMQARRLDPEIALPTYAKALLEAK